MRARGRGRTHHGGGTGAVRVGQLGHGAGRAVPPRAVPGGMREGAGRLLGEREDRHGTLGAGRIRVGHQHGEERQLGVRRGGGLDRTLDLGAAGPERPHEDRDQRVNLAAGGQRVQNVAVVLGRGRGDHVDRIHGRCRSGQHAAKPRTGRIR